MRIAASLIAALFAVTAPASASDWVSVKFDALGFSASFPGEPKAEETSDQGTKLTTISSTVPEVFCLVVVGDYPAIPSIDGELIASRNAFLKGVAATLVFDHMTQIRRGTTELPALSFDAASPTHHFHSIIVVDKLRVYQVVAGVPLEGGLRDNTNRCIGNFKLTP